MVFKDRIWILAGSDAHSIYGTNDVWASADGKNWELINAEAPWPKSFSNNFLIFQDKIWMLEGGDWWNMSATRNIWASADGKNWTKKTIQGSKQASNSALVFKNRIWLTGGSYDREFSA